MFFHTPSLLLPPSPCKLYSHTAARFICHGNFKPDIVIVPLAWQRLNRLRTILEEGKGDYESDLQAYLGCRPTHCKELGNLVIN